MVVDPVKTRTAQKADWHIPHQPGHRRRPGDGMMNVIIAEGLVDRDYVEKYTVGYEDLKARAEQFPPEKVAALTGVAADDMRKLAREYARRSPSVIRMGVAIERHAGGGNTYARSPACRRWSGLGAIAGAVSCICRSGRSRLTGTL